MALEMQLLLLRFLNVPLKSQLQSKSTDIFHLLDPSKISQVLLTPHPAALWDLQSRLLHFSLLISSRLPNYSTNFPNGALMDKQAAEATRE